MLSKQMILELAESTIGVEKTDRDFIEDALLLIESETIKNLAYTSISVPFCTKQIPSRRILDEIILRLESLDLAVEDLSKDDDYMLLIDWS